MTTLPTDDRDTLTTEDDEDVLKSAGRDGRRGGPAAWNAAIPTEKSSNFRETARRFAALLGEDLPMLVLATVLAALAVVMLVFGPYLLGKATDTIVSGVRRGGIDMGKLHGELERIALVYLAAWAFGYGQTHLMNGALQRAMHRLRRDVEAKLHRLPLAYVDGAARGDLLSRVTNDIDNLAQSLQQTASQVATAPLMLIGVTIVMLTVSPLLTLIVYVTVPIAVFVMRGVAGRARPKFIAQWRSTGELNAQAEEMITGHAIVTSFGRQAQLRDRFDRENEAMYRSSSSAQFTSGLIQPVMVLLGNLQYVSIAVIGGLRIASGAISVGDMQAMLQYVRQFSQPMQQVASMSASIQSGMASLERVLELLDADEMTPDPASTMDGAPTRGRVVFDDVHFSYQADRPLITGLDLVAEPGQTIAIVGPTGAGKTTLVNLLMRFYELDGGRITIDGVDIASLPRQELRAKFGMVLQDTWLFGGTIRENLRYGNPDATEDDIQQAAKVTYVDRFVHSLPQGYDTLLTDEGSAISAGEKQLVTIARAFLADPAILILDEATSSVDTRTEMLIQEAMNRLRADRTSFVIAHRLSTIRGADVILVMDGGRIVEQGSHDELIARKGGAYAALYAAQFAGHAT